jgi:two-component system OmpR family sensor kinase
MPCGSRGQNGAITISAAKKAHLIEAMVQDTGFGMSAGHLPHLFERFYKVDRSRRDGGTSLSLAIVQQIIEVHGGQVLSESKEGEGRAFGSPSPGSSKKLAFLFARDVAD